MGLTAGHCFRTPNLLGATAQTSASVTLGTTTQSNLTEFYIHPNWWNSNTSNSASPSATAWNSGYDVALIHLPQPFVATAQYPGNFDTDLSNVAFDVGDQLLCSGYGYSTVPSGNGGTLRNALLPIDSFPTYTQIRLYSYPIPMINVSPNNGQEIYEGDSGGSCYVQSPWSDPYLVAGINESVDYGNGQNAAPTEGHLVYPWYVKPWVEQTMYAVGSGTSNMDMVPFLNAKVTSASISIPHTGADNYANMINTYVVATQLGGPYTPVMTLAPTTSGQPDSWIPYTALGTYGLPAPVNGTSMLSPVGLAATVNGGFGQLYLAAVATDSQLYVASFNPLAVPVTGSPGTFRTNFIGVSWSSAGAPPVGLSTAATPAIGLATLGRSDYFVLGADSQYWTRWSAGGVWQSDWMQIPNTPAFQSGPSVAVAWSNYLLAGVGTDGQAWLTWMGSGPTYSSYGGPWVGWSPLGGGFISGVAISGWNRGADITGSAPTISCTTNLGTTTSGFRGGTRCRTRACTTTRFPTDRRPPTVRRTPIKWMSSR